MKKYIPIILILVFSIVFLGLSKNKNKDLKENSKKDSKDIIIASYVNGVYTDVLPTESKYFGYVKCFDNSGNVIDSLGFVTWENNKWNVKVTDISASGSCNVYFIDPPAHWLDAENGTLLKAIKDNNRVENVKTLPGKKINKEDEAILSGTLDDYGTSYFFRGNVQNNYVVFNNMCWKIVRIDGNGNIKLILQNERGTSCEVSDYNYNYARWNGTNTTTAFNNVEGVYNTASGSGFMYGDSTAQNFMDAQANTTTSTLLTRLQDWYDRVFTDSNVINNLADVIWCGDKSLNSGVGYGNTGSSYGAYLRLINKKGPSLKCPTSDSINGDLGNISKYTAQSSDGNGLLHREIEGVTKYYPIGLITADEAAYAGGVYAVSNNTYYLYNGNYYWTISPSYFYVASQHASVMIVYSTGTLTDNGVTYTGYGLRPAVSLNYNVQATYNTGGTDAPGTVNNPYVVSVN